MNAPLISVSAKARAAARPTGEITLEIDGRSVTVSEDCTVWEAARDQGMGDTERGGVRRA